MFGRDGAVKIFQLKDDVLNQFIVPLAHSTEDKHILKSSRAAYVILNFSITFSNVVF